MLAYFGTLCEGFKSENSLYHSGQYRETKVYKTSQIVSIVFTNHKKLVDYFLYLDLKMTIKIYF